MQFNFNMKIKYWPMLLILVVFSVSCKDDTSGEDAPPFDPGKPMVISRFTPESGGLATRLVLYGNNFGNDISKVRVTIGGKNAKVIGVKGTSLHCMVPAGAYDGDIVVAIVDDNEEVLASVQSDTQFDYQKQMLVSTFLGEYVERAQDAVTKDGPFDDCGSFRNMRWLSFDPQNPDRLYMACQTHGTRVIDFEMERVGTFSTSINDVSSVNFMLDGDMVVTSDHASDAQTGLFKFSRASGFTSRSDMCKGRGVKASAIHPVDGEVYFTRFRAGDVQRFDPLIGAIETGPEEDRNPIAIYPNPYAGVHFMLIIHPTGNYGYLVQSERHFIMRTDYNWETKRFMPPYLVCGAAANAGYADGVGSSARLNWPMQGTFVKNPEYEGQQDEYDFYFADRQNHAIRKLTPVGRVETFAGRGNNGVEGYNDGQLRTEARFNRPESIVWDEKRQCFYVGDTDNRVIRKIGYEE